MFCFVLFIHFVIECFNKGWTKWFLPQDSGARFWNENSSSYPSYIKVMTPHFSLSFPRSGATHSSTLSTYSLNVGFLFLYLFLILFCFCLFPQIYLGHPVDHAQLLLSFITREPEEKESKLSPWESRQVWWRFTEMVSDGNLSLSTDRKPTKAKER